MDGVDRTGLFVSDGSEPWSIGKTLNYTSPTMPKHVVILFNQTGGGGTVLAIQDLFPGISVPQAQNQGNWYFDQGTTTCNWAYRKKITISHNQVPADQASFPVLISLSSDPDLLAHAQGNGNDILFTQSDGLTKIPHEIDQYAGGTLIAWVNVPTLSSSTDTVLYMYYGNTSSTPQNQTNAVWANGYQSVWHLDEVGSGSTQDYNDSTSNHNYGWGGGGGGASYVPTRTNGKIGVGQKFNGISDYIATTNQITNPQTFTESLWFQTTNSTPLKMFGFEDSQTGTGSGRWDRICTRGPAGSWWRGCTTNPSTSVTLSIPAPRRPMGPGTMPR